MYMFDMVRPFQTPQSTIFIICCILPGERTPVGVRMSGPPANIPEHWMMCNTPREFQAAASDYLGEVPQAPHMRKVVERPDGSIVEGEWYVEYSSMLLTCLIYPPSFLGELTDLGKQVSDHSNYHLAFSLNISDYLQLRPQPSENLC